MINYITVHNIKIQVQAFRAEGARLAREAAIPYLYSYLTRTIRAYVIFLNSLRHWLYLHYAGLFERSLWLSQNIERAFHLLLGLSCSRLSYV